MLFSTLPFIFLVLVTMVVYYLPFMRRWQIHVLTAASFFFYGYADPVLLLLLVASIVINVVTSYKVAVDVPARQRLWAALGVALNLGLLLFFKYSPLFARTFLGGNDTSLGQFLIMIPLPLGISFFTFQGISLVVEVFQRHSVVADGRKRQLPELVPGSFKEHLRNTMLFKSFFPNLVAGPIVKAHEFYPQIAPKRFNEIAWESAFRSLVTGYFLKVVIADNLKDWTFWIEHPHYLRESTATLLTLLYGYQIQVFADFAGYSLIAIGLARLFGYTLPTNFNYPYISKSFTEFWQRWHISLSTWLRQYLYIPLGGSRRGPIRTYVNMFAVMVLGGLWHGAAWSYALWGAYHGIFLLAERYCRNWVRLPNTFVINVIRILFVFWVAMMAALPFKLTNFHHVIAYLQTMATSSAQDNIGIIAPILTFSSAVVFYHLWHLVRRRWTVQLVRHDYLLYGSMLFLIILNSGSSQAFIYFQF